MKTQTKFKIGDSVKVKANVKDPDFDIYIEGWQGRISGIEEDGNLIHFKLDSLTLDKMPDPFIDQCEEDGLDWTEMVLEASELEVSKPRDTEKDVKKKIKELSRKHAYSYLGEQGKRIQKVLKNINPDNVWKNMEAWGNHFKNVLQFPFEAEVSEVQDDGPLDAGDKVKVVEVTDVDDLYGVIVKVRQGRKGYYFPLCDLEVCDKKSSNYTPVNDYAVWFANR